MTTRERPAPARTIVLALGNDLLGDDGLGPVAAQLLAREFGPALDVVTTAAAGLALLELLEGYDRALIVDAITTGESPPGTVLTFDLEEFGEAVAPSPHFSGLPEVAEMAARLEIHFPREVRALAMEIEPPLELREGLGPAVAAALPTLLAEARRVLAGWGCLPLGLLAPQPPRCVEDRQSVLLNL